MTDTILTETVVSPLPHGEGLGVRVEPAPVAAVDPALSATAQRIADLQAQVLTLQQKLHANGQRLAEAEAHSAAVQQKLHSAEQHLAEAASRAAELLAQPEPAARPVTITAPRIEVRSIYDVSDNTLAKMLNDGWTILHMQIMDRIAIDEDDRLHVVLQRTTTAPQPQPRPTVAAAAPVPPVAPSINMPPIPRPQPQPARVVSGTVMSVDDNAAPLRTAVENYVHTILKDKTLTADERNQRLTEQAIANVRARAAERATAGAPLYRPITAMEMSL